MKFHPLKPGLLVLSRRQQEALQTGKPIEIRGLNIHRTLIGWAMPPGRTRSPRAEDEAENPWHRDDYPRQ